MRKHLLTHPSTVAALSALAVLVMAIDVRAVPVRLLVIGIFLLVAPGAVIVRSSFGQAADDWDWPVVTTVVVGVSIAVNMLIAEAMVRLNAWSPSGAVLLLATACTTAAAAWMVCPRLPAARRLLLAGRRRRP